MVCLIGGVALLFVRLLCAFGCCFVWLGCWFWLWLDLVIMMVVLDALCAWMVDLVTLGVCLILFDWFVICGLVFVSIAYCLLSRFYLFCCFIVCCRVLVCVLVCRVFTLIYAVLIVYLVGLGACCCLRCLDLVYWLRVSCLCLFCICLVVYFDCAGLAGWFDCVDSV